MPQFHDIYISTAVADQMLQAYTKGAIYRQMQEYSRKAANVESRLEDLQKKTTYHDDHIRLIDAWWTQVSPGAPAVRTTQNANEG